MANAGRPRLAHCLVERRAQQGGLNKVIEMPGLQGSVLTVVSEAQELAGVFLQSGLTQVADGRETQNRCRGATAFRPQRREFGEIIALPRAPGDPTV